MKDDHLPLSEKVVELEVVLEAVAAAAEDSEVDLVADSEPVAAGEEEEEEAVASEEELEEVVS